MAKHRSVVCPFASTSMLGACIAIGLAVTLSACSRSDGPSSASFASTQGQFLVRAKNVQWGPAPPGLPAGAKVALLQGDPTTAGPFVMRLELPAKYKIAFHSFAKAHDVTVMSGALYVASTETFDKRKAFSIKPGDFYHLPAQAPQFLFTKDVTVVEIHGEGPYDIKYANVNDDPLKGAAAPQYFFPQGFKENEIKVSDADASIDMTY